MASSKFKAAPSSFSNLGLTCGQLVISPWLFFCAITEIIYDSDMTSDSDSLVLMLTLYPAYTLYLYAK